jgi:hypothetical protein
VPPASGIQERVVGWERDVGEGGVEGGRKDGNRTSGRETERVGRGRGSGGEKIRSIQQCHHDHGRGGKAETGREWVGVGVVKNELDQSNRVPALQPPPSATPPWPVNRQMCDSISTYLTNI